jgi:hypothetical protein
VDNFARRKYLVDYKVGISHLEYTGESRELWVDHLCDANVGLPSSLGIVIEDESWS